MKGMKSFVFALLALPVIVSCNNEDALPTEIADREIALGLSLDKHISSRASIPNDVLDSENYIIKGEYAIIMNLDKYKNQVHCCRFGTSVLDNGRRGNIYIVTDGTPAAAPLKWSDETAEGKPIKSLKSFDFTIDNLGYTEECTYDAASGFLGKAWSDEEKTVTYAAQKEQYDADGNPVHTNDIIWGSGTAQYGQDGKEVSYAELTHRMTRVSVAFVNLTEQQQKDMTVSLTNLVLQPESFNRADGTVAIAENPQREDLCLLQKGETLDIIKDETAEGNYEEHVTANYILPPQALTEGQWPEIVVTYTDDRKVHGLIPHDILNEDGNTWEALDGLNAGNHLTIVAEINNKIPDIVFTAKVRKWVELGPVTVTASQGSSITPGIHNMEELERCIELYNDLPQFDQPDSWGWVWDMQQKRKHFGELMQYGDCKIQNFVTADEAKTQQIAWKFYINFDLETLPATGFRYMLGYLTKQFGDWLTPWTYPLTFVDKNGVEVNRDDLINKKGIYNMEDLNHMILACNELKADFMRFYGDYYEDNGIYIYTVDIRDEFSGELINKLKSDLSYSGKPIKVVLNTNGFKVNGEENIGELIGIQ